MSLYIVIYWHRKCVYVRKTTFQNMVANLRVLTADNETLKTCFLIITWNESQPQTLYLKLDDGFISYHVNNLHEKSFNVVWLQWDRRLLTQCLVALPGTGLGVVPPKWLSSPHWPVGERNPELSPHTDIPDDTVWSITWNISKRKGKGKCCYTF